MLTKSGLIAYASAVGRGRNLDALRAADWRFICSPGNLRNHGLRYALDNGARSAFQNGLTLNVEKFSRAVDLAGEDADFVVLPDIVMGGAESLEMSVSWLKKLGGLRLMLAVQDGFEGFDLPDFGPELGVFVGGSTDWKLKTLPMWADVCRRAGAWCHVGRVNSVRRIRLCSSAGVMSFDGSGPSRYSSELPRLDFARRQSDLFSGVH